MRKACFFAHTLIHTHTHTHLCLNMKNNMIRLWQIRLLTCVNLSGKTWSPKAVRSNFGELSPLRLMGVDMTEE